LPPAMLPPQGAADLDGDGKDELYALSEGKLSILRLDGSGPSELTLLGAPGELSAPGTQADDWSASIVREGDGSLVIWAASRWGDGFRAILGEGGQLSKVLSFHTEVTFRTAPLISAGDTNGDGMSDVVIAARPLDPVLVGGSGIVVATYSAA